MGKEAGWFTDTLKDKAKEVVEKVTAPEFVNVNRKTFSDEQDEKGRWLIDKNKFTKYVDKPPEEIDMADLAEKARTRNSADLDLMVGMEKAIQTINAINPPTKATTGLKIALYRMFYHGDPAERRKYEELIKKWYHSISGHL
ncbi:MAG: hypothetical protein WC375_09420 [Methanomassiliicoccales archaeon]